MPELEIPKCACGLAMQPSRRRPDFFRCANCDFVQPQEMAFNPNDLDEDGEPRPFPRNKTPWDMKYAREMSKREKEWYAENG